MPAVPSWDDFFATAQALFLAAPSKTRLLVKYRHVDGKLEVKITDNSKTFKFITDNTADQRKVDHLTSWLATEACNPERAPAPTPAKAAAPSTASRVHPGQKAAKMSGAQRRKAARAARAAGGAGGSVLGEAAKAGQTAGQRAKIAAKVAAAAARKARREERRLLRNAAAALAGTSAVAK